MARLLVTSCCLLVPHGFVWAASVAVYVDQQGGLFGVTRSDVSDPVSALTALATPPSALEAGQALSSAILPGTRVLGVWTEGDTTTVNFSLDILGGELDEARLTVIFQQVTATLRQFGLQGNIRLQAEGKLLSDYLAPVIPVQPAAKAKAVTANSTSASLSGKTIALSPGHGYMWNGSAWVTQRPVYCSPLNQEDFHNCEEVMYLNTYLTQDGATTKPDRCLDKSYGNHSTGHPWWQMAAYAWLQNRGYPCSVYANYSGDCTLGSGSSESSDDIRSRPLAADYDSTDIYVALHSNGYAGDCTSSCPTGSETYYDSTSPQPAASRSLATAINAAIMAAITGNADSTWTCHGTCVKDSAGAYGEIRIPSRAATLTELAFHDSCNRDADTSHLQDNFFRSTATWGMYKGICDYFGVTPTWAYYSDEIVSHDIPTSMNPGATATVHIIFRNRGVLWNDTRGFQLGAVGESDPFTTTTRYAVGGEVGPSTTKTFTLTFTAPTTPGTYTTDWRMLRNGVTWFGATLSVSVNVGETGYAATWGPYDLTNSQCIYYPANSSSSLRTGWYTTTSGTGAARNVLKAADSYMATMPDASIVSGSSFTVTWSAAGTYSASLDSPLNLYRIGQAWTSAAVWNSPWSAGGNYSSVGTSSQSVVYPTNSPLYTFSVGAGYNFPYGVMMKGDTESGISYRKGWLASGPYPTLSVSYTTPTPTIRSWAYLGWYDQGATTDRQLRIDTDQVAGTYGGVPVTEADLAPKVGGASYGNSYGTRQWQQGAYTNDLVDLNSSYFYNAVHENAVTYCCVYVYNAKGSSITGACLGIGSDDGSKVWWNGTVVGSDVVGRGVAADSDFWGPVTINNGWNRLMVKVENGGTGHGVYARFANANRTALTEKSYLSFYTTDATAPSVPTSLAASGVTSGVWQNTVAAPTFTWTSGTDSQGSGQGVSGVRGQKYYFGASSSGSPGTFQTGVSYAPGTQADGAYYFKVDTVDYALNESIAATFTFLYDATAPTGVNLGFGTITTDSITVTGSGTDAHSGINAAAGYNYSRAGASNSGAKGATHTWTGLDANTEYTNLLVTVSDQVSPTPNMAASSPQSKWTLSVPPAAGSVTPDQASPCVGSNVTWTAANGFGLGQVQYYRYAWDTTPTHAWTEAEPQWSSGTIATVPDSAGTWYLHIKGYNGAAVGNGAFDYAVTTSVVYSQTNSVSSMVNNGDGTFTLNFVGTPQAKYFVVTSPDPWTLMSGWTVLPNSTNTAPSPGGIWSVTATNNASQRFYRSAAVDPAP
jgi:N-acetylmuramoyl-L-alanine amidase